MYSTTEISVLFEEPFWVALFECYDNGLYSVSRNIIGTSEPHGVQLAEFFDTLNYANLRFTNPVLVDKSQKKEIGFKKQMHKTRHAQETRFKYVYTKAHAMLKNQYELVKTERKKVSKIEKENELQLKFELWQKKKKEKHKGH